ncbi:AMP-binding protein [Candidatus Nitrospira salsa]
MNNETLQHVIEALPHQGHRPAVIALSKDHSQTLTFSQLHETTLRFATGLSQAGLLADSPVVLLAPNQPEWIVACCALLVAGAIPVPIDYQMQEEDLQHVLSDSQAQWVFTTTNLAQSSNFLNPNPILHVILLDADSHHPQSWKHYLVEKETAFSGVSPESQAVLFYTSGTSGRPKGVPLTHRNLLSNLQALLTLNLITEDDRLMVPLPFHHVYPFMIGMLAPLAVGIPIVIPYSLTGPQLFRTLHETQPTAIIGIPRLYEALDSALETRLRQQGTLVFTLLRVGIAFSTMLRRRLGIRLGRTLFGSLHKRLNPQLRTLVSGGAALESELAWKLEGVGWQVGTGYGLTETSPILTVNEPGNNRLDTAGRPLPGVELKIAKSEDHAESGEVLVKGPNVFSGYWNLPDKNTSAFTDDGYFRTGDLGTMQNGYLYLVGRASSMIVLPGGENIRPDFIEDSLNQTPHVQETGVLAVKNKLVAVIVPKAGSHRGRQEDELERLIREDLERQSQQLPSHHRLSDYVLSFDPLPRTRLGKIRRHLLQSLYEQAKHQDHTHAQQPGPLPLDRMSPEDQHLLSYPHAQQAWNWLCKRFPDIRLTPDSNIQLDLGVDSLEWINLTLELQEAVGINFDQEEINRIETVREFLHMTVDADSASNVEQITDQLRHPDALLDEEQQQWLTPPGPLIRGLGSFMFRINRWLMKKLYNLTIHGIEHLPPKGPFVITSNHTSLLDPLAIAAAFSNEQLAHTHWGGWTGMMFTNPLMRGISRAARVLPIDQSRNPLSSLALGIAVLKQGNDLVWFPEGERSLNGKLHAFRPGIGYLLATERIPIVPAWITGTYEALPRHRWRPRVSHITVRFGKTLSAQNLEDAGKESQTPQQIADALYTEISNLSGDRHEISQDKEKH